MLSKRLSGDTHTSTVAWPTACGRPAEPGPEAPQAEARRETRETPQQTLDRLRQEIHVAAEATARQQWEPKLKAAEDRLARAVADVAACKARLRREVEGEMVELALAIARKVVRRELTVDPSALTGIARAALERVSARDIVRVRVAPAYREALNRAVAELGPDGNVTIEADSTLSAGGLVIETRRGALDASIDGQFDEIERGLTDRLEARR